eukprot:CAMPEP_0184306546 /NCGR_PEP_ID=MMETSP1049-20130417/15519_1 /TAXON_ID=77928 /ORGANISM="Proteomonas sulcata, Strain CCMP704" /LENGTH=108 /DNA_ID=CAMNT_0026618841 /DNA_START=96 /DNA_END=422 /DNA_ORIENTATION=+
MAEDLAQEGLRTEDLGKVASKEGERLSNSEDALAQEVGKLRSLGAQERRVSEVVHRSELNQWMATPKADQPELEYEMLVYQPERKIERSSGGDASFMNWVSGFFGTNF